MAIKSVDPWDDAGRSGYRRIVAALIGDWLAADTTTADRPDLSAITAPRARLYREIRQKRLCWDLDEAYRRAEDFGLWLTCNHGALDKFLENTLRHTPSSISTRSFQQPLILSAGTTVPARACMRASMNCFPAWIRQVNLHIWLF